MKFILKCMFIFLISLSCYSITPKLYILFINGVNSNVQDVVFNLNRIKEVVNVKSNVIEWGFLYNPTSGSLAQDLHDTMKQKKQEGKNLSIDDYVKTYMKTYKLNYFENSKEYNDLKKNIKEYYSKDNSFVGKNLDNIIDQFNNVVKDKSNSYVLLIAHSQGNLYANQLYDYLINGASFPKSRLSIVGIATPSDKILGTIAIPKNADQNRYITSDTDFVITSLNIFLTFNPVSNKALPANVHITKCEDQSCHGIVTSYLNDDNTRSVISSKINAFIASIKKNILEEQLSKNINVMFWMNEQFSQIAILRSGLGKVICANGTCDKDHINYIDTNISEFDEYNNYKWSSDGFMKGPFMLLVPNRSYLASPNAYFFIRGNISIARDYVIEDCAFNYRDQKQIEKNRNSPFYNIPYANIETMINFGCPIPNDLIADNGRHVILGEILV
jgi:hypothetical protein